MIQNFYISCGKYRPKIVKDGMGVETLEYYKHSDVTGVVIQKGDRVLVNDVWQYKNIPVFITNDLFKKLDRVEYKGVMYEISSEPDDIMERNHHYEFNLEALSPVDQFLYLTTDQFLYVTSDGFLYVLS